MRYPWIEYYSHRRSCFAAFISAKPFMLIVLSSWRLNKRSRLVYSSSKTAFFHVNITWLQPLQTLCNWPCEEVEFRVLVLQYISDTWGLACELLMPIEIRFNERQPRWIPNCNIHMPRIIFLPTRVFSYVELDDQIVKSSDHNEHI